MATKRARRGQGEGSIYQRADGLWVATIEDGMTADHKRRRWTATSKDKAKVIEKLQAARARQARYGTLGSPSLTLGQWLDRWLEVYVDPTLKPRTAQGYRALIVREIKPRLGRRRILDIGPGEVERMLRDIATPPRPRPGEDPKPARAATARAAHRVLRAALSDAVVEGVVGRNVATGVHLPAHKPARPVLAASDVAAIVAGTVGSPDRARWLLALDSGVRQGEALGLGWESVDLDGAAASVEWQLQRIAFRHGCGTQARDGSWPCGRTRAGSCPSAFLPIPPDQEHEVLRGGLVRTRPKSAAGVRVVALSDRTVEALREHRARTGRIAGLVFTDGHGNPIDPRDDAQAWKDLLARLEIAHVGVHSARRTTATVMRDQGVDVTVVRDQLGHGDIEQTRSYQQARAEQAAAAVAAFVKATS